MSQSLVVANLFARPMRTLATVLAIGMEVVLILLVVGLTRGMVNENAKRLEGIGADIVLQPPGSSFMLASSTAAMSEKLAELLAGVQGVSAVSPCRSARRTSNPSISGIMMSLTIKSGG